MNVDTGKSWPDKLETLLNDSPICTAGTNFEVINLGVPGYDIEYTIERFIGRGMKYSPDLVVWFPTEYERVLEKMIPKFKDFESNYFLKAKRTSVKELGKENIIKRQQQAVDRFIDSYSGNLLIIKSAFERSEYDSEFKKPFIKRPKTIYVEEERLWDSLEPSSYLPDRHFSERGHMLFAEKIYKLLNDKKDLFCKGI
jgi:hypothetical protein